MLHVDSITTVADAASAAIGASATAAAGTREHGRRAGAKKRRTLISCRCDLASDAARETLAVSRHGHAASLHSSIATIYNLNLPTISSFSTNTTLDITTVLSLLTITSTVTTTYEAADR